MKLYVLLIYYQSSDLLKSLDIESAIDVFYDKLFIGFTKFIPVSKIKKSNHPVWMNRSLLSLKNRRLKAFKKFKLSGADRDYIVYLRIRSQYLSAHKHSYINYLEKTQKSLVNDPSKFWKYVQSKKKTESLPSTMTLNGKTVCDIPSICELFARFF